MIRNTLIGIVTALLASLTAALPGEAAEHWAVGEWAGKMGSGDIFLEIRDVASNGTARGGIGNKSPTAADNPNVSISVRGTDVVVTYAASTQIVKLSKMGEDLVGTFTDREGRATKLSLRLRDDYRQYLGVLYVRGSCTGLSRDASIIIEGNRLRGAAYLKGYEPDYFAGEMDGDSFQAKLGAPSFVEVYTKRKGDTVSLELKGPDLALV